MMPRALCELRQNQTEYASSRKDSRSRARQESLWFERYRTVDGYNVYGGRSHLKFVDNISNRDSLQREMEVLDVMTSNRDSRIWAAAHGKDFKVDDSNTPPFIEVKSNRPGKGPNGENLYLDGEEAISHMKVGQGMKVNLFASEKEFPVLSKPVQMAWGHQRAGFGWRFGLRIRIGVRKMSLRTS